VTEHIPIHFSVRKKSTLEERKQKFPVRGNNVKHLHIFTKHVTSETSAGAGTDHEPQTAFGVNNQTPCNL